MMTSPEVNPPSKLKFEGRLLQTEQLLIYRNWCKGCGICINMCPTEVLAPDDEGKVFIAQPDECTSCKICELHCPDFAINVVGPRPKREKEDKEIEKKQIVRR